MSDAVLAIVRSPTLWSAVIATVVYVVMLRDPSFPKPLLDLYVGIVIAFLSALGITGVVGVVPAVRQAQAARKILAAIASRRAIPSNDKRILASGQRAFEAYAAFTGGQTYDGKPIPNWPDLSPKIRDAWAFAEAAAKLS